MNRPETRRKADAMPAVLLLAALTAPAIGSATPARTRPSRTQPKPMGFPPVAEPDASVDRSVQPHGTDAGAPTPDPTVPSKTSPDGGTGTAAGPTPTAPHRPEPEDPESKKWKPSVGSQVITPKTVNLGDPVDLTITVIHAPEVSVNLPSSIDLGEDFSITAKRTHSSEKLDDGKIKEVFVVRLSPFRVGNLKIPPVPVTFSYPKQDGGGGTAGVSQVHTEPVLLRVASVMANEPAPKLKPNDPPVQVLEENRPAKIALLVIACILAGALLGFAVYRWLRKRKRKALPPAPARPAHEIALEKLDGLKASDLLQRAEFTEFYFGVSEAIREYFGNRYNFDSLEMTTTELLDMLKAISPHGLDRTGVQTFCKECDLTKFAKYLPSLQEAHDILERAYDIVHTTTPTATDAPSAPPEHDSRPSPGASTDSAAPPGADGAAPRPLEPEGDPKAAQETTT